MSIRIFVQIMADFDPDMLPPDLQAVYDEMTAGDELPFDTFYIRMPVFPEEFFEPYIRKFADAGYIVEVTAYEPRDVEMPDDLQELFEENLEKYPERMEAGRVGPRTKKRKRRSKLS